MKFNKKIIWYSLPILLGGFLIYKQFNKGKNRGEDVPPPPPPTPSPSPSPNTSQYPLAKGTKNGLVGSLQSVLNTALQCKGMPLLTVDDNFGSKTEAALKTLTGKTSVASASEFEAVKRQLASVCSLSGNLDWAWKLIDAQNTGRFTKLVVNQPIKLYKVEKDFRGLWIQAVPYKEIVLNPTNYSLNDYKLRSAQTTGNLRLEIMRGDLAGMYITKDGTDLKSLNLI